MRTLENELQDKNDEMEKLQDMNEQQLMCKQCVSITIST